METQNTFAKILENESVTVSALLCAETLKITVKVTDSANVHFGFFFSAEITEQQRKQKLNEYFYSLKEVLEYLGKYKLIKISLEEKKIILFELMMSKKQLPYFTTELIKTNKNVKEDDSQNASNSQNLQYLEEISNLRFEKSELKAEQIKRYFEIIANEIMSLKRDKANKKELNKIKEQTKQFLSQRQQLLKLQQSQKDELLSKIRQQISLQRNEIEKISENFEQKSQENYIEFTEKISNLQQQVYEQNEKIEALENKINEKSEKITENSEKLAHLSNVLCKHYKNLKDEIERLYTYKNDIIEQRLMDLEQKMFYLKTVVTVQQLKQFKLQELKKQELKDFMLKCKNQMHSEDYDFDGKTKSHSSINFLSKKIMSLEVSIFVGFVDYEDYVVKNDHNGNNLVYYSSSGLKYPMNKNQGTGYKVGDIVTVTLSRSLETVKWFVNDRIQVKFQRISLGDKNRKLFPCVCLYGNEEAIEVTF